MFVLLFFTSLFCLHGMKKYWPVLIFIAYMIKLLCLLVKRQVSNFSMKLVIKKKKWDKEEFIGHIPSQFNVDSQTVHPLSLYQAILFWLLLNSPYSEEWTVEQPVRLTTLAIWQDLPLPTAAIRHVFSLMIEILHSLGNTIDQCL